MDLHGWPYYRWVLLGLRLVLVATPALAVAAVLAGQGGGFAVLAGLSALAVLTGMALAFPLVLRLGRAFRDSREPLAGVGAVLVRDLLTGRRR
jgi:hypothetical protein